MRYTDVALAVVVLGVIMLIVLPLPAGVLDVMLILNIALSIIILVGTLNIRTTLDFSIFPSLLLITTLLRLALTISSTRLILGNGGQAGHVIHTFGSIVIGGNYVVGIIIFLIIVIIQFIVITKGAERVSEVAARFTLDAMPGKQMAIDADLNTGLIDEQGAKARRTQVQREASFYGAMDGASKFVKGDAIVALIVVAINAVGGIIIGAMSGMDISQALPVYLTATVGDGLVSQIPALLISTSMGVIVTRSDSDGTMGSDFFRQLFSSPIVMYVTAGMVFLLSFVGDMPMIPMWLLCGVFAAIGVLVSRQARPAPVAAVDEAEELAAEKRKPESVTSLLQVNPIDVELGYAILPMLDPSQGGDLPDRVIMIRRQAALEMGIIMPVIRFRDNIQISTNEYVIKIKGVEVARGEVMTDHFLALNPGQATGSIPGIPTTDPTFGLPALWITEKDRERAELMGYTTIDAPSVIATHLTEIIKRHGHELLNRQQVLTLVENLKQSQPALVEDVVPKMFSLGELQKILSALLQENIPIRDLGSILETLGDYGHITRDTAILTDYVRQALQRTITRRFVPDGKAHVITLDASLERMIAERVRQTEGGAYVAMEPENMQRILLSLKGAVERVTGLGMQPVVLTAPNVRRHFKRMVEQLAPDLIVLSYNELEPNIDIIADGMVSIA